MTHTLLFLSGAAMHPETVRSSHPAGRFVARARIACPRGDVAPHYAEAASIDDFSAHVWGIVVRVPSACPGAQLPAVTDEGATLDVVVAETPFLGGEAEAALEAALYWELPPAYTIRLRDAAGVAAPEAEGGWESMDLGQQPPTV